MVHSTLHVDKQWSGNGQKPESITVDIKQGNDTYKTVTLKRDDSGKWSTDVIIPAGAQKTYTVTEVEPDSHLWKASYQHKVGDGNLADGNVVTVPESTASQNATVVITNTLKTATLKNAIGVKKELVGRELEGFRRVHFQAEGRRFQSRRADASFLQEPVGVHGDGETRFV